ncbi:MAG TPA: hypothetical protein VFY67_03775 [Pyrinomonadaceae bacterium]|nr:hypothetical protein [Pyrinomonadaceae bacterium]
MADDRMKNDDLQRNMGTSGKEGQNFGQQTPGRQGDQDIGHEGGGHGKHVGGQKGATQGGYGGSQEPRTQDDDEFGGGTMGQSGGQRQNRGGQNQ